LAGIFTGTTTLANAYDVYSITKHHRWIDSSQQQ